MSYRKLGRVLLCFVALSLAACAPKQVVQEEPEIVPSDAPKARQIEPEARALYSQAERAFGQKNYDQALRLFQQVKMKYPRGTAQYFASYRLGIIYYYKEAYTAAGKEFENFVTHVPQSELNFDATYNWAAAEYQLGKSDAAIQILRRLKPSEIQSQGPKRAETVYQLMARCAATLGNRSALIAAYAYQLQLPLEDKVRQSIEEKVDEEIVKFPDRGSLEQLAHDINEPIVKAKIQARLAQWQLPGGNQSAEATSPVQSTLPAVVTGDISRPTELPSGGSSGQSLNVGVVLPLSGRWSVYGKRALDGIMLAARLYGNDANSDFRIFVEDSGSSPLVAQNAVEELVKRKSVMAVIGPLNFKEAVAAAEKSQSLGVLNLSLASKEGLSEKGPYLFQNALIPKVQLEALVRYCIGQKQLKRFAILAPNNAFGKDMAKAFWDQVEKYGGKVSAQVLYPPEEKDFQGHVQELAGVSPAQQKYRRLELAKLAEFQKEQKAKTGKEPRVQLTPLKDFDAIFIPDSPKTVNQITPSLAFFDLNQLPILGTTEWNSDQFIRRGSKYISTAIFPSGLYVGSRNARTQEFVRSYTEAYGSYPDLLATQAYEAMELIGYALRNSRTDDRNVLVNALGKIRDFETPLGTLTFDANRVAIRHLSVLELAGNGRLAEFLP